LSSTTARTECAPADVSEPEIGEGDVLVKVSAAGIKPLDKMVRDGEFKRLLKTPFVLGHDVAGVVTRVGPAVRDVQVGDQVYARPRDLRIGTFAGYVAIDQGDVAPKPVSLTPHEAAAVPLVSLAAWQALVDRAHVKPGQRVLVHAGSGGLGSTVIQLSGSQMRRPDFLVALAGNRSRLPPLLCPMVTLPLIVSRS
jgi:NADPH:quinone reductase-like Zn-dependent oxidoreductase